MGIKPLLILQLFVQAQKWLNQKGLRADMAAQAVTDAEQDKPRPQGLGLGAAFLPHHKVCRQISRACVASPVRGVCPLQSCQLMTGCGHACSVRT